MPLIPAPIIGVSCEKIEQGFDSIKDALRAIKSARAIPAIRVVLELEKDPADYFDIVRELHGTTPDTRLAYVMAEIADSFFLWKFNKEHEGHPEHMDLKKRLKSYLDKLGEFVDVWEIGNEVNGEWAGWREDPATGFKDWEKEGMNQMRHSVASSTLDMYRMVTTHPKGESASTALTLYFYMKRYPDCLPNTLDTKDGKKFTVNGNDYDFETWLNDTALLKPEKNFSPDYVLLSVYEDECRDDDCRDQQVSVSDWVEIFKVVQGHFKNAQVGFGETGSHCARCDGTLIPRHQEDCIKMQKANINQHYGDVHLGIIKKIEEGERLNYIGGYFNWYFHDDMVQPGSKPLKALTDSIRRWP